MANNKQMNKTIKDNSRVFIDYRDRLELIARSIFSWDGLDDVAGFGAERFLEWNLFYNGKAVFVKDDEIGFKIFSAIPSDKLNVYRLPSEITAFSIEYSKNFKLDDVVLIMNNEIMKPTVETINLFSERLYEIERTININVIAQKTPVTLTGSKKSLLTLINLWEQYSGNLPFIFADENYNLKGGINALKTDAPYVADKLTDLKHDVLNECLEFLGIENANTDKKERLITDEVNSNNEIVKHYLASFYKTRKKACDMINEKFFDGVEVIKLKVNEDMLDVLELNDKVINEILSDDNIEKDEKTESIGSDEDE